jgi:hypothetical protein
MTSPITDDLITSTYIKHAAWMTDKGAITCACGRDNLIITEHAKHFTDELNAAFKAVGYVIMPGVEQKQ